MKLNHIFFLLLATLLPFCAQAQLKQQVCAPETPATLLKKKHPVTLVLKSIDNSNGSGVTRIGIDLQSIPSTSSRLDSAVIINGNVKKKAIDVDGVDFQRYFQWEENGVVYIELDFPFQKKLSKNAKVILHTVHGDYTLPLKGKK